mgnify:CR=1 FL=1
MGPYFCLCGITFHAKWIFIYIYKLVPTILYRHPLIKNKKRNQALMCTKPVARRPWITRAEGRWMGRTMGLVIGERAHHRGLGSGGAPLVGQLQLVEDGLRRERRRLRRDGFGREERHSGAARRRELGRRGGEWKGESCSCCKGSRVEISKLQNGGIRKILIPFSFFYFDFAFKKFLSHFTFIRIQY